MNPPDDSSGQSRRTFIKHTAGGMIGLGLATSPPAASGATPKPGASTPSLTSTAAAGRSGAAIDIALTINGRSRTLKLDPRTTLLDALRDHAGLTGTKKGCDRGECGACTVHLDGRRALSCLTLAAMADGCAITTIEGLAQGDELHAVQTAFIEHDAFQCGFCTSGQIMSGVACIREGHAGSPEEVGEFMSGNLCRCAAYPQIRAAILAAAQRERA